MMLTMEEAIENGLVPFVDDRVHCRDCLGFKPGAWKGICQRGKIQFANMHNNLPIRCNMYAKKVLQTTEVFWETEEKPFWEI